MSAMIPTHFDHSENLRDDEQERTPSSHNTWLAIVLMLAILAAVVVLLSLFAPDSGDGAAQSVATTLAG